MGFPLHTTATPLRRWRTVNTTATSFPTLAPTGTPPVDSRGSDVSQTVSRAVWVTTSPAGGQTQNALATIFYGVGSDTNTMLARLILWKLLSEGNRDTDVWVPMPLFEVTATLGPTAGVGSRLIPSTNLIADTLVVTANSSSANDHTARAPNDNTIAVIKVDCEGPMALEMLLHNNSSSTSCNAMSWWL